MELDRLLDKPKEDRPRNSLLPWIMSASAGSGVGLEPYCATACHRAP